MKAFENVLDTVGNTPMVRLNKVTKGLNCSIYAKLEFFNPMGSIKDRIAKYIIEKAEREGKIKKGQLIIENSSGNTALGLALVAIQKGYKLKVVVRDSLSKEKMDNLISLGVDVIKADTSLPPEHPESYNNVTPNIVKNTPDCYFPDQHNNRDNNEAHYKTTGPEIWEQMEGKIDYLVAGIGTGGTICGISRFLKEKDPKIKVFAVDSEGSIFHHYFHTGKITKAKPYLIEGLGDEFIIGCPEFNLIDDMYQAKDKDAFLFTRKLVKEEGIMAGGSSGAALWASLKLAKTLKNNEKIVTIFPDSANRYLSSIFNDKWMKEKGML